MPFLDLLILVVIVGSVSIYLDRRFIRNRGASRPAAEAPATPTPPAAAPVETPVEAPAVQASETVQEVKNGSN